MAGLRGSPQNKNNPLSILTNTQEGRKKGRKEGRKVDYIQDHKGHKG
jgi:hypothetical protein